jgi:ferric-dicitrate binding protein FerR (iron transport regulator)
MKDETQQTLLLRFILKQTTQQEEKEVLDWLNEDETRYQLLEKLLRANALHAKHQSSLQKSDLEAIPLRPQHKKTQHLFFRIAAIFTGLFIASFAIYFLVTSNTQEWETIATNRGQQKEITLADGTKIWLAPASELQYTKTYSGKNRLVKLDGQAYFSVTHDKAKPFQVQTLNSVIQVLGTKFNVNAYSNETETSTILVEGKVNVQLINNNGKKIADQLLFPSQKCTFNKTTEKKSVHKVDLAHELAWRDNRLSFKNETFFQIAKKIERHYDVNVVFQDGSLTEKRFTGEFDNETIEDVLETFQEWSSFEYTIENKVINLKSKPM